MFTCVFLGRTAESAEDDKLNKRVLEQRGVAAESWQMLLGNTDRGETFILVKRISEVALH